MGPQALIGRGIFEDFDAGAREIFTQK